MLPFASCVQFGQVWSFTIVLRLFSDASAYLRSLVGVRIHCCPPGWGSLVTLSGVGHLHTASSSATRRTVTATQHNTMVQFFTEKHQHQRLTDTSCCISCAALSASPKVNRQCPKHVNERLSTSILHSFLCKLLYHVLHALVTPNRTGFLLPVRSPYVVCVLVLGVISCACFYFFVLVFCSRCVGRGGGNGRRCLSRRLGAVGREPGVGHHPRPGGGVLRRPLHP